MEKRFVALWEFIVDSINVTSIERLFCGVSLAVS